MTPKKYLEWEEKQAIKYEYINGKVLAMTGKTLPHNDIAINLTSGLKNHLLGKGCKVQRADAKVGVLLQIYSLAKRSRKTRQKNTSNS